jgi:acetyltransferase
VARYEGRAGERSAEIAVVVDDALQHHGIGRVMLERLSDVAAEAGLDELAADVLAGNAAMLGLLRTLGLPRRTESDGDTVTVLIDVSRAHLPVERRERAQRHLAAAGSDASAG